MPKKTTPPIWINRLLEHYCDSYLCEGIIGDLNEAFYKNCKSKGPFRAQFIFFFQSIGFLRATFKNKPKNLSNMRSIWLNYFLTSFRSLKKNKSFFVINLTGLVVAITCSLIAMLYIDDEFQFDKTQVNSKNIHRLYKHYINPDEDIDHFTYETSGMMGPTMTDEFPEVEKYTRICPWFDEVLISYNNKNISTDRLYIADSTFFDFFNFKIISGNPSTLLNVPSSIVLSQSLSKAVFGDVNPIGKVVTGLNDLNYTVTGVFEDIPRQSSLQFDALVSWSTTVPNVGPLSYSWMNNWLAQGIFTFVQLTDGINASLVEEKLPAMMNRHFSERADQYFLKLIPFDKMYLHSDNILYDRGTKSGSITFVYILGLSALLILIIASFNYINISLSRSTQAKTEVGIRKVMGSSRGQLIGRFISETFISTVAASLIGIIIVLLIIPEVNGLIDKDLPTSSLLDPMYIAAILGFIFVTCIIVGIYPALILSASSVTVILKNTSGQSGSTGWLRKTLLAFQYAISIFLISCTFFVIRQTNYLENKPLGIDKEQVLVVDIDNEVKEKIKVFESELLEHPNIISVSISRSAVGAGSYSTTVIPQGHSSELTTRIYAVDQEFFETYGVNASIGRTFLKGSVADSNNLIVNQAMIDFAGWKDPIGKHIRFSGGDESYPIIGVVNDFHIHSLATTKIEPMVLYLNTLDLRNASIKIGNGNVKNTINHIHTTWDKLANKTPFDFYFVDEWFNKQYKKEKQLLRMSSIYAIVSIILCALGLYGLTSLMLQQRSKEISIRKVLGAPLSSILSMINQQFVIVMIFSFLIATPVAYSLISNWLDQFAYKTSLDLLPFILSGGLTLLVSLTVVTSLSIKSANNNPSENLRSE